MSPHGIRFAFIAVAVSFDTSVSAADVASEALLRREVFEHHEDAQTHTTLHGEVLESNNPKAADEHVQNNVHRDKYERDARIAREAQWAERIERHEVNQDGSFAASMHDNGGKSSTTEDGSSAASVHEDGGKSSTRKDGSSAASVHEDAGKTSATIVCQGATPNQRECHLPHFGKFNLVYDRTSTVFGPNVKEVRVTVKPYWQWEAFPGQSWSPLAKDNYKLAAKTMIYQRWNVDNTRRFRCTGGAYNGEVAKAVFKIQDRAVWAEDDFTWKVHKWQERAGLIPSNKTLCLFENDAGTVAQLNQLDPNLFPLRGPQFIGLASGAEHRLNDAFQGNARSITVEVGRTQGQSRWHVKDASKPVLDQLAGSSQVSAWPGALVRPSFIVQSQSKNEAWAFGQANAIEDYMKRHRCQQEQSFIARPAQGTNWMSWFQRDTSRQDATVTLSVETAAEMLGRIEREQNGYLRANKYCIAAHEFGHCLGLPDEYKQSSVPADTNWRTIVAAAGLPAPTARSGTDLGMAGQETSIMHKGVVIEKHHMATIWEALKAATTGQCTTWTIE